MFVAVPKVVAKYEPRTQHLATSDTEKIGYCAGETILSSTPQIEVRVYEGTSCVLSLRTAWDDLFARVASAPPYLSPAWLLPHVAQGSLHGRPVAITAWSEHRLHALLLLSVHTVLGFRIAKLIGTSTPAYLGFLADPTCPVAATCVASLCLHERLFDCLVFSDLSSEDSATRLQLRLLQSHGFYCRIVERNACCSIHLASSFDLYLSKTRTSKQRHEFRRKERRLLSQHRIDIDHYRGRAVTLSVLARAAAIQQQSWMKKRGAAVLGDPWYQTLLLRAARRGLAEIWILRVDDDDAAFALGLRAHSQFHYAWTAFKLRYQPLSIGNSLHSAVIRTVCEEGCARLDFGHGNSQWKRFWATDTHTVSRAALGRGLRGRLVAHAYVTAWQLARFERCRCAFRTARSLLQSTKTRLSRVLHSSALSAETAGGSTSPHQAVGISARAIMMTDRVDVGAPRECQLMTNWAIAAEPPHWRVARRMRRLLRALVRFRRTASSPTKSATPRLEKPPITHRQDGALQPGDRVRIRDLADIEATLDATSRYHGCAFLKPMARYCGREFRVVRCVERFFDERQWRMLKCKNIVLLEGAYCDGSGALSTRGCDRMCFFFWRTEWLEKLT